MRDSVAAHPVRTFMHDALFHLRQYNFALPSSPWCQRFGSQLHLALIFQTSARNHVHTAPPRFGWLVVKAVGTSYSNQQIVGCVKSAAQFTPFPAVGSTMIVSNSSPAESGKQLGRSRRSYGFLAARKAQILDQIRNHAKFQEPVGGSCA